MTFDLTRIEKAPISLSDEIVADLITQLFAASKAGTSFTIAAAGARTVADALEHLHADHLSFWGAYVESELVRDALDRYYEAVNLSEEGTY